MKDYSTEIRKLLPQTVRTLAHRDTKPFSLAHGGYMPFLLAQRGTKPFPLISTTSIPDPWPKFMAGYSWGLAVSAFPCYVLPSVTGFGIIDLGADNVADPARWDRITAHFQHLVSQYTGRKPKGYQALKSWNYSKMVENLGTPSPMDIPTPRLYDTEGRGRGVVLLSPGKDHLKREFYRMLMTIWDAPPDNRVDTLYVFLDHHHAQGAKPMAFRDLVAFTAARMRDLAKVNAAEKLHALEKGNTRRQWAAILQREADLWGPMADKLDGWLRSFDVKPTTSAKDVKAWPNLRTLALFHAVRFAAGDKSAHLFTVEEANEVALLAGYTSESSGKRLRDHYNGYSTEAGRTGEGTRATEVMKRYASLIPQLEPQSKALELARREREEVIRRSC